MALGVGGGSGEALGTTQRGEVGAEALELFAGIGEAFAELGSFEFGFGALAQGPGEGAGSGVEIDAERFADFFGFAEAQEADFASARDVSATAGATVQTWDGDDAEDAVAIALFAETLGGGGVLEGDFRGEVLAEALVGAGFDGEKSFRAYLRGFDVDGGFFCSEMEADGFEAEFFVHNGAE